MNGSEPNKIIKEWKEQKADETTIKEFDIPKKLIDITLKTKEFDGLILYGEGGLGKTFLTINEVKKLLKPDEWDYFNGYSTPLSLYEILFNNRDKRLLILDDIEGLFNNPLSVAILKGALWDSDGKRLVQYNSKSEKAHNLQSTFEIKAKLIILCNKISNSDDITVSALINRTIPYEVKFSYQQKIDILKKLIDKRTDLNEEEKEKCFRLIKENTSIATKNLSLRTLKKIVAFVREEESADLFKATTEVDEDIEIVNEIISTSETAAAQVNRFIELTGRSRATFFRIKKKIDCLKVSSSSYETEIS